MTYESTHGRHAFDEMAAQECERDDRLAANARQMLGQLGRAAAEALAKRFDHGSRQSEQPLGEARVQVSYDYREEDEVGGAVVEVAGAFINAGFVNNDYFDSHVISQWEAAILLEEQQDEEWAREADAEDKAEQRRDSLMDF